MYHFFQHLTDGFHYDIHRCCHCKLAGSARQPSRCCVHHCINQPNHPLPLQVCCIIHNFLPFAGWCPPLRLGPQQDRKPGRQDQHAGAAQRGDVIQGAVCRKRCHQLHCSIDVNGLTVHITTNSIGGPWLISWMMNDLRCQHAFSLTLTAACGVLHTTAQP